MRIDNFALTMFQSCPAKYKLRMKDGWTSRRKSSALNFGGVLHLGLAAWHKTGNLDEAVAAINEGWPDGLISEDYRDKAKCLDTIRQYARRYDTEAFKVLHTPDPMIECTFTLDTGLTLDDGEPIEYGGIFDGLVESSDVVYVLEHKSTSQLGPYYFNQYKPNNQVTGYVWAAGEMTGGRVGGAIINAIGVFKAGATRFERQITTRNKTDIDNWLANVKQTCELIRRCEKMDAWPLFTPSCTQYGLCEYHSVHLLSKIEDQLKMLETDYVQDHWQYETRADVK